MPLTKGEFKTDAQRTAVATLMRDIGYIENAMYGPDGTSIYSFDFLKVPPYMDYSSQASYVGSWYMSATDFIKSVEDELLEGHPVLMSGDDREYGHAFVADGFDEGHRIRYNWGWSGSGNGYYTMEPYIYKNASLNEYRFNIDMMVGFVPGASTQTDYDVFHWSNSATKQLRIEGDKVPQKGVPFKVGVTSWKWSSGKLTPVQTRQDVDQVPLYDKNYGTYGSAQVKLALVDRDGNLKEFISEPFSSLEVDLVPCLITKDIEDGDTIRLYYLRTSASDWFPVEYDTSLGNGAIALTEKVSLQETMSVRIEKRITEDYNLGEKVRFMEIVLKDNTGVWLANESGSLISGCGIYGSKPTVVRYTPGYRTVKINLSELKDGKYQLLFKRPLDDYSFDFTL